MEHLRLSRLQNSLLLCIKLSLENKVLEGSPVREGQDESGYLLLLVTLSFLDAPLIVWKFKPGAFMIFF